MKSIELKASLRAGTGKKSSKNIRKQGLVPCVMYGGAEIIHFNAEQLDFRHIIFSADVFLVSINIDGKKYNAILHDAQYHPVTDVLIHADFIQVSNDKPTVVSLPITIVGNSIGVRAGGKLRQRRRYLKVRGLSKDLPETLSVDISKLKIGNVIRVSDLKYPKVELLDSAQSLIVGVSASRVAAGGSEVEEEEEVETAVDATTEGSES